MNNMKLLVTGLNGLVGSRIQELLHDSYDFTNVSRSTGVDVTDEDQIIPAITSSDAPIVLHLTAKTDVDGCERDKDLGTEGEAWKMNVLGTQYVANACKQSGKKMIHISTDFVFDGEKEEYTEEDTPHPINWYGMTKYKGEEAVQNAGIPYVIVRPAYPYGRPYEKKKDFVQAILGRLQQGNPVVGITDHIFVPTFIDDLAYALDALIKQNAEGVYHVTGSQALSPYEASLLIAQTFGINTSLVQKTTRETFFKDRAPRPHMLYLKNDKLGKLGVTMHSFEQGLIEVKKQMHL